MDFRQQFFIRLSPVKQTKRHFSPSDHYVAQKRKLDRERTQGDGGWAVVLPQTPRVEETKINELSDRMQSTLELVEQICLARVNVSISWDGNPAVGRSYHVQENLIQYGKAST